MAKTFIGLVTAIAFACFAQGACGQVSTGTAFAVAPGLLVTNQHVVDNCSSIEVIASDGRRNGAVVDADAEIDLALLRVNGLKGATARLRNPRIVRLGESVMVFGFPLAGSLSSGGNFTSGVVSGLRGLRDAAGELQVTAPVQPGNSGGPLMDASGLVIGVVQSKLDAIQTAKTIGDIPQNVNFAISLEVLADFLAKNKVSFRDGVTSAPLDTSRVAQLAQGFTYRVECRAKSRQAMAPKEAPRPPLATEVTRPPSMSESAKRWIDAAPSRKESQATSQNTEGASWRRLGAKAIVSAQTNNVRMSGQMSDQTNYIDIASIRHAGKSFSYFTNRIVIKGGGEQINKFAANCEKDKLLLLSGIRYTNSGEVLSQIENEENLWHWSTAPVASTDIQKEMIKLACEGK